MKMWIIPPMKSGLCAALLLFAGLAVAHPPSHPPADEAVILTGWLHVEDLTMADAVVEVEVNGVTQIAPVNEQGRFTVTLPADAEVLLRFQKPGHLSKEVVVDTRHARTGEPGRKTRHVKFAVIMELERWMGGLAYSGPVGSIGFDPEGGCVAVEHDRKLEPAKRHKVMRF